MRIKRIRINRPLYVDPNVVEPRWKPQNTRYKIIPGRGCATPGNQVATLQNMHPEAHARRVAGMIRSWASHYRRRKGIKPMTKKMKRQTSHDVKRGQRQKIRETVARELRDIQDIARRNAVAAMEVAKEIMANSDKDSDRLAAANLILERGYGKATQTNVNANVNANGSAKEVSAEELNQRVGKALSRVEELTGRSTKPPASQNGPAHVRQRHRNTGGTSVH